MSGEWVAGLANEISFVMTDADGNELTGLTLSITVRTTGGSFAAALGSDGEISNGWYYYICDPTEAVVGPISVKVTAVGAVQQNLEYVCEQRTPGVKFYPYRVTDQPGGAGNPLAGVNVWVTLTNDGNDTSIWNGYTDSNGYAKRSGRDPLVPLGTNYFWKYLPGYDDDDNPDIEVVT